MRRWLGVACSVALACLTACAAEPTGPSAPVAREQIPASPAFEASAARQAVVEFLAAYATSTSDVAPLAGLVAGDELESWVRWLGVQHREFDGGIDAEADLRDVEFLGSVDLERIRGAQVGLSATVTFAFEPAGDDAFQRARILDGLVTLVRGDDGYRVLDLYRDGVPMTDGIELFRDETQTAGDVSVTLDSMFMFAPNWQFNVVVTNPTGAPLVADPDATGLFVGSGDDLEAEAGAVTGSILTVPAASSVEGILAAPLQDATRDRTLVLTYRSGDRILRFAFPLGDLATVVPPEAPGVATGSTGATA